MAIWAGLGHAIRRRSGMPMSHHEAIGKSVSRNHMTPEEIISSAEHANSPRRYVGMDATKFSSPSANPVAGTLVGKKNKQAGTMDGVKGGRRTPMQTSASKERMGARYGIGVKFPKGTSPEAAATMANARIVPSVSGRQNPNFQSGTDASY